MGLQDHQTVNKSRACGLIFFLERKKANLCNLINKSRHIMILFLFLKIVYSNLLSEINSFILILYFYDVVLFMHCLRKAMANTYATDSQFH